MYKVIQPEVIVGLGIDTEFVEKIAPFKRVKQLHLQIEDWLGDDLMECHPCYIITENLKNALQKTNFSGFSVEQLKMTKSEYFSDNHHIEKTLPLFYWLKINGHVDADDIYVGEGGALYCAEPFIDYLKQNFTLNYLEISPQKNEFDDLLDKMIADSKPKI
jgi:hypothetical protein